MPSSCDRLSAFDRSPACLLLYDTFVSLRTIPAWILLLHFVSYLPTYLLHRLYLRIVHFGEDWLFVPHFWRKPAENPDKIWSNQTEPLPFMAKTGENTAKISVNDPRCKKIRIRGSAPEPEVYLWSAPATTTPFMLMIESIRSHPQSIALSSSLPLWRLPDVVKLTALYSMVERQITPFAGSISLFICLMMSIPSGIDAFIGPTYSCRNLPAPGTIAIVTASGIATAVQ